MVTDNDNRSQTEDESEGRKPPTSPASTSKDAGMRIGTKDDIRLESEEGGGGGGEQPSERLRDGT